VETSVVNPLDTIAFSPLIFIDQGYLGDFLLPRFKGFHTDQGAGSPKGRSSVAVSLSIWKLILFLFPSESLSCLFLPFQWDLLVFLFSLVRIKRAQHGFASLGKLGASPTSLWWALGSTIWVQHSFDLELCLTQFLMDLSSKYSSTGISRKKFLAERTDFFISQNFFLDGANHRVLYSCMIQLLFNHLNIYYYSNNYR